jgi:hypothetical protein
VPLSSRFLSPSCPLSLIVSVVACVCSDLFYILERSDVFDLISRYLRTAALEKRSEFLENKFQFLQIVCDHEHYVQLNRPMPIGGEARTYLTEKEGARVVFAKTTKAPPPKSDSKSDASALPRDLLFPMREQQQKNEVGGGAATKMQSTSQCKQMRKLYL